MERFKILVTGANGQVGQELLRAGQDRMDLNVLGLSQRELDITQGDQVLQTFERLRPHACIHAAAYTAVDQAEREPDLARAVNVQGSANVAQACRQAGIPCILLSTDYVYHGSQARPLREDDPTEPRGVYALTKLQGEQAAQAIHPQGLITIRTAWIYSRFGSNFVKTMLRLGAERSELRVVFDQIGSPTWGADLAQALLHITDVLRDEATPEHKSGIYHYSNEGVCSWYDLACAVMDIAELPCRVLPIESDQYPTPAMRPPFSLLNKAKIKAAFGLDIPHWRESLCEMLLSG